MATTTPRQIHRLQASIQGFLDFFNGPFAKLNENPNVANFAVGNPLERPMPAYVDTLRANLEPRRRNWFAYQVSDPKARIAVAREHAARTGMAWDPEDVAMTNGGFAALAVAMRTLVEPGDEVIFLSPPWFFYEFMILAADATPVRVRLAPPAFEPDLEELAAAFAAARAQADALTVLDDGFFIANPGPIADLAKTHRLPSIGFKEYGDAGGLLAYAVDFPDMWRRSMTLVDRILRGAKPQDLPIQQATRFELALNMKTARSLGLAIPPPFLARVDKVIE